MDARVKSFIEEREEKIIKQKQKEKEEFLIELGLYEKEFSEDNQYSEEYSYFEWDSQKEQNGYYRKKALNVNDDEYQQIKLLVQKDDNSNKSNIVATIINVIAWVIYIIGFISGFVYGYDGYMVHFEIAFTCWCIFFVFGTMFLGFAEIIKLLNYIKQKL